MGISYEEALKAQRTIEDKLLEDPNIVSIGVVEETDDFVQKTGDYSIKVGVIISAEIYQNYHDHSIIPREYRFNSEKGALEIKNVPIKVVKTGQIKALSESRIIKKYDLPSATDDIPGYTQGKIISISETVKVDYGKMGIIKFKNQICTISMSKGGNSGSCLFEAGTKKPVGLLFSGDESQSFHNPIKTVLSSLSMFSMNRYPSGRTHTFSKDNPFKIIRRTYASTPQVIFTQNHIGTKIKGPALISKFGMILGSVGIYAANKISLSSSFQSHIPAHRRKFK